jgi:hypothetical protein
MYHDRGTRKLSLRPLRHKGGGGSILQRFFLAVRGFIPTSRSTLNHIHKLK